MAKHLEARDKILMAALKTFPKLGYGGTTLSELSRQSGLAKSHILYHFATTDDILAELAIRWGESGRQITLEILAQTADPSPLGKVEGMIRGAFKWMRLEPDLAKLTPVLLGAMQKNRKAFREFSRTIDVGYERMNLFLKPRFPNEKQRSAIVLAVHSQLFGALLYLEARDCWSKIDLLEGTVVRVVQNLINGG